MSRIYIAGVGMTQMGKLLDRSVKSLTAEAVGDALGDASMAKGALQAACFSNATQGHMEGQEMIRGEIALREMGIEERLGLHLDVSELSGLEAADGLDPVEEPVIVQVPVAEVVAQHHPRDDLAVCVVWGIVYVVRV